MKNLLLLACLLACVLNAHAQYDSTATVIDSTDYEFPQKWQRLYANVPTDSVHTGYFIDRVLWLNNHPARFNGIIDTSGRDLNSTDTVYFEAIANLHQGLIGAYVGSTPNTVLLDSTDLLLQKAITYIFATK